MVIGSIPIRPTTIHMLKSGVQDYLEGKLTNKRYLNKTITMLEDKIKTYEGMIEWPALLASLQADLTQLKLLRSKHE